MEAEPLGPEPSFDEVPEEDAEHTPTPTPHMTGNKSIDRSSIDRRHQEEMARLQSMLNEKDRAIKDQHNNIAEMERNLTELQSLVPELAEGLPPPTRSRMQQDIDDEDLPKDVAQLRAALREKNEKIKLLTAEFDNNRADFRSTIDTLEMASSETERVYEKRVEELLEEVRHLQDRSEDVESVAQQLRQLEELVQELEEGLEDARRGEAEARGEVEFLRGEVERSRSELRRERERKRTEEQLNGYASDGGGSMLDQERIEELQSTLDGKEDEIRGLKTIIRNLQTSDNAVSAPKVNGAANKHLRNNESIDVRDNDGNRISMQQQIRDLEAILQQKSAHEEELEIEVTKLRNSVHVGKFPMPGHSQLGLRTGGNSRPTSRDAEHLDPRDKDKHASTGTQGSQRTVVLSPTSEQRQWHDASEDADEHYAPAKQDHESEARSEASGSSAAAWCEICEEAGHDILSCKNMLGINGASVETSTPSHHSRNKQSESMPAPLMSRKSTKDSIPTQGSMTPLAERSSSGSFLGGAPGMPPDKALPPPPGPVANIGKQIDVHEPDRELKMPVEGTGAQAGMWAGKVSGVIDPDKWCALCERDGHESVDCPIEDAF
jgi:hypothetical protein